MKKIDELIDDLLTDGVCNIVDNAIKKILDKTKGNESARERLIVTLFNHCIYVLMDSKYNRDEKIYYLKEEVDGCINIIDAAIEVEKYKEAKKYLLKKESKNAIEFYDVYP